MRVVGGRMTSGSLEPKDTRATLIANANAQEAFANGENAFGRLGLALISAGDAISRGESRVLSVQSRSLVDMYARGTVDDVNDFLRLREGTLVVHLKMRKSPLMKTGFF